MPTITIETSRYPNQSATWKRVNRWVGKAHRIAESTLLLLSIASVLGVACVCFSSLLLFATGEQNIAELVLKIMFEGS